MTVTETIRASLLFPSQGSDFTFIFESPIQEELQVVDQFSYGAIRCERGVCVLVTRDGSDGDWRCWIDAGTKHELVQGLQERFHSDPEWYRAVVLPCQTDEEAKSMGAGLARLLSESTDLALTEPVTRPSDACTEPAPAVVVVERILYFLGYWKKEATQ